jgi:hypothetical protein
MVARRHRSEPPTRENVRCTSHALERYRLHQPAATINDVLDAWQWAESVSAELAQTLTGRRLRTTRDRYRIAPDHRGMFVLSEHHRRSGQWVLITYLRFTPMHTALLGHQRLAH